MFRKLSLFVFVVVIVLAGFASFDFALTQMNVPAVDANNQGILTHIQVDAKPGTGNVYVDVQPFISVETQNSARTAAQVGAQIAGKNLSQYDLYYKIIADTESVDGPSGGLALTLLTYSELTGRTLRPDLTATGTIELTGSVGPVGGVAEKMQAAASKGMTLALIPLGERIQNGIDLAQLAENRWGLQVVEVKNVKEALNFAFTPAKTEVVVPERVEPPLLVENVTSRLLPSEAPFADLARNQLQTLTDLSKPYANDSVIAGVILKSLNATRILLQNGYYYSAANEAFITQVQTQAFTLSNESKTELSDQAQKLKSDLAAYTPSPMNDQNLEWSAGARLRLYWAQKRLSEVEQKLDSSTETLPLLEDYSSAVLWFSAARQMDQVAANLPGNPVDQAAWSGYAQDRLIAANKSLTQNPGDTEAVFHWQTAKLEFAAKDYVTATFDAAFVLAFSHARSELVQQAEATEEPMPLASSPQLNKASSLWGQLYYAHALYSLQEANRTGDYGYVVNAFKLVDLSQELDQNAAVLKKSPPVAPIPAAADSNPVLAVPTSSGFPTPYVFGAVGLLILGLFAGAAWVLLRKPASGPLSPSEKMELLEQRLLEGKISEETYRSLSRKFGTARLRVGPAFRKRR